jgi:hypothetical protein
MNPGKYLGAITDAVEKMKRPKLIREVGYALVVPKDGRSDSNRLASTSAPTPLGGGTIWQIYKTKRAAVACARRFGDVRYDIRRVTITAA